MRTSLKPLIVEASESKPRNVSQDTTQSEVSEYDFTNPTRCCGSIQVDGVAKVSDVNSTNESSLFSINQKFSRD